ncbi:hypothetical protein HMPREF1544_02368 [Mucor circinelloides 1006PhL]|uniref:Uncharacterized protein n=1 Tax=Mucor circinelloides f. circinelloides (strain 1006PhL) TaxID=1220926 RepID=S2KEK8_MUCC1|nr:hypothetical protein HMPREF1544_02368 [Mucor circinelloides 1006PhL]
MTDQAPQRTRLTKSKATASTTAIQTLEITTTAVVTGSNSNDTQDASPPTTTSTEEESAANEIQRKQSHHHHHHRIRSPAFEAHSNMASPLPSPQFVENTTPVSAELMLPPPIVKGPSEAIVALQDAANATTTHSKKPMKKGSSTASLAEVKLFEQSFFSAAMLIQWSNLVGPKVEKMWSVEPLEEKLQMMIGRQVLNGEMGRTLKGVEPKWIVLHRQAIICTAFLFHDPTLESLCALVLVVPVRYLRNFSQYFRVLCDRIPIQLVEPVVQLRKVYKRHAVPWSVALNYFKVNHLMPFVQSVMDLESVSLPIDCVKTSHTILDHESRQMLESPFIAKVITSHLQTFGSTLLVGNTLTSMNMVINTLALFLSLEERSRSSHARKHHHYMSDLYLQGLLIQDVEEMETKVEIAVLDSTVPTTLVDMTRLIVRKTPLFNSYHQLKSQYHAAVSSKLEDNFAAFVNDNNATVNNMNDWNKRQSVFERTDCIAPMVQTLLDETRRIPTRMREAYLRQWRRSLIKRALAMIKFVQDETPVILCQPSDNDLATRIMNALALYHMSDFTIVLTQAEKLRPGMVDFITTYSKRLS